MVSTVVTEAMIGLIFTAALLVMKGRPLAIQALIQDHQLLVLQEGNLIRYVSVLLYYSLCEILGRGSQLQG